MPYKRYGQSRPYNISVKLSEEEYQNLLALLQSSTQCDTMSQLLRSMLRFYYDEFEKSKEEENQ